MKAAPVHVLFYHTAKHKSSPKTRIREPIRILGLSLDQKDTSDPFFASDMAIATQKLIMKIPNTMLSHPPLP